MSAWAAQAVAALEELEQRYDARLGVFAVDTGSGRPGRDPIVLAVMSSRSEQDAERVDALVAAAVQVVAQALG